MTALSEMVRQWSSREDSAQSEVTADGVIRQP